MAQTKVYLVNHTHWDREWYFSNQDSRILSDLLFTDAIKELEKHQSASFTLDGQSSIVEDYLKIRPDMQKKIEALIKAGQLIVGPWYTQPDALHISGESLLRNGIIGKLTAQKYGKTADIGYLPDTFGFNAQMPVILNELGLDNFIFWRGIDPKLTGGFYFKWHSLGRNRQVTAINFPQGYGVCKEFAGSKEFVEHSLDPAVKFIEDNSVARPRNVLIPIGNDQMAIKKNFAEQVKQINHLGRYDYETSDYSTFSKKLAQSELNDYSGPLLEPLLARVHRTCGSSRMDIKLAASRLENKLVGQVEPLMIIGKKCGIELQQPVLVEAWKKLLASQAHDSMAGSITDPVAADVSHRLKEGTEIADGVINTIERLLADQLKLTPDQVLLINPLPKEVADYHRVQVVTQAKQVTFPAAADTSLASQKYVPERQNVFQETVTGPQYGTEPGYYISDYLVKAHLPALGYRVLEYQEVDETQAHETNALKSKKAQLSGKNLTLEFSGNVLNLKAHETTTTNFLCLIDSANTGDTYDSSPLEGEKPYELQFDSAAVDVSGKVSTMTLSGKQKLPHNLTERRLKKETTDFTYQMKLTLLPDDRLQVHVAFDNNVFDHQVKLKVKTPQGSHYQAGVPFGSYEYQDNDLTDRQDKYAEKPVSVWPLDHWVTAYHKQRALTVYSIDCKEFSTDDEGLKLTLLATTDQLGKEDLINRPGRASGDTTQFGHPMIATPQAELQQHFDYDFTVSFSTGLDLKQTASLQEKATFQVLSYQKQELNLFLHRLDNKLQEGLLKENFLPRKLSLLNVPEQVAVTACYPAYFKKDKIVLRLNNATSQAVAYTLPNGGQAVNALEQPVTYDGMIAAMDVLTVMI